MKKSYILILALMLTACSAKPKESEIRETVYHYVTTQTDCKEDYTINQLEIKHIGS